MTSTKETNQSRADGPSPAVRIIGLTKVYKLYDRNIDRLKESIHPLGKKYHRKFSALSRVNLEIKQGEVLGIVGKNGAGKSTLLNIIAGVTTPTSGEVTTRGKVSALLGLGTGFNPELTGIENIYLYGTLQGYAKPQMDAKLDDILAFADIGNFVHQPIKIYSNGMQARLGFAAAIHVDPDILIVDEVLAVGDELFKRKCYARIDSFMQEGKTILFVSHTVEIVNQLCTRAVFLDAGELILEGPPKLVTTYYLKYLYAKSEDRARTRDEIVQLNRDAERKAAFSRKADEEPDRGEGRPVEQPLRLFGPQKPLQIAEYLSGFESKTKVIQKNADIDVFDIKITTRDGRKVNYLVSGEEYFLEYRIRFNTGAKHFAFSWTLKNEKGVVLTGARHPGQKGTLASARKNDVWTVRWKFRCALLEGAYFFDIGLPHLRGGVKKTLVALYDILAFKVQKPSHTEDAEFKWGLFDMDQTLETIQTETGDR
jgi:lipopolysaccharide transport system ATP-binding protein